MKHIVFAALLAMLPMPTLPSTALAHGAAPAAQHGGIVAESSDEHWVELVLKGNQMIVYVNDQANKPVPSAGVGAKATVLVGGKAQQVVLVPADANALTTRLDPAATGKVTAVVTLTIGGKSAQVRFATTQP